MKHIPIDIFTVFLNALKVGTKTFNYCNHPMCRGIFQIKYKARQPVIHGDNINFAIGVFCENCGSRELDIYISNTP